MKRTKVNTKKPIAILVGDIHLRETQPVARLDDFWETQWRKINWLKRMQQKYDCPVWCSGDLFHHWKPSPFLLSKAMQHLPKDFHLVYGNHDLPQHSLENAEKSGVYALQQAGAVNILPNCHWGEMPGEGSIFIPGKDYTVLVWHVMTWWKELPYPGCPDPDAARLLKKYNKFDLILTGHNHIPFAITHAGRWLVNPGSFTRQGADETHEPRVYLYYGDSVEPLYVPIDENPVLSREHLDDKKKRDERIDAFVSRLNSDWETSVSFEENLERFFASNEIETEIKNVVYKAIDYETK